MSAALTMTTTPTMTAALTMTNLPKEPEPIGGHLTPL